MQETSITPIKLGGSVITYKKSPYKANISAIENIARSLKKAKTPLLISHGSGSFGHTSASIYGGMNGYVSKEGIAKVCIDAMEINRIVMEIFLKEGIPAISFSPRSFFLSVKGKKQESFFGPVEQALAQGLTPVVYGDVIFDRLQKTTIFSGETTLNHLCRHLKKTGWRINNIIQLCDVEGVIDENNNVLSVITQNSWKEVRSYVRPSDKRIDVTGAMAHKIEDALTLTPYGIKTLLINGYRPTSLTSALNGKKVPGTVIQ